MASLKETITEALDTKIKEINDAASAKGVNDVGGEGPSYNYGVVTGTIQGLETAKEILGRTDAPDEGSRFGVKITVPYAFFEGGGSFESLQVLITRYEDGTVEGNVRFEDGETWVPVNVYGGTAEEVAQ